MILSVVEVVVRVALVIWVVFDAIHEYVFVPGLLIRHMSSHIIYNLEHKSDEEDSEKSRWKNPILRCIASAANCVVQKVSDLNIYLFIMIKLRGSLTLFFVLYRLTFAVLVGIPIFVKDISGSLAVVYFWASAALAALLLITFVLRCLPIKNITVEQLTDFLSFYNEYSSMHMLCGLFRVVRRDLLAYSVWFLKYAFYLLLLVKPLIDGGFSLPF